MSESWCALLIATVVATGCGGGASRVNDASDGASGQTYSKDETDWERDWSAGEVGCSPDDIQVMDMSGWGGNKTWTAVCQGQTYHCTSRYTSGAYGSDHDVSCTPSGGASPAAAPVVVREKPIEWATSTPPTQAIGYTFGDDLQTASRSCLDANNSWKKERLQFRCSGLPFDVGLPGQSTAAFCGGKLCVVTAYLALSESEQASQVLRIILNDLVKKYGTPTKQRRIKRPICDDSFVECVEQAEALWEGIWKWRTGEVLRATTMSKDGKAHLAIRYQLGEPDPTDGLKINQDNAPVNTSAF